MKNNQTHEFLLLTTILDLNVRFSGLVRDLKGEVFDIRLDFSISKFAADEALSIEDTGEWVGMSIGV